MQRACEAGTSGQRLAALVPARVDTRWFHEHVMGQAAVVYLVRGRLSFTLGGRTLDPAPFPVLVAHYLGCAPAAHGGSTRFVALRSDGRVEGESRQMVLL
jgi:site-specific DNA-methyltransferase (adenine-specific)